MKYLKQFTFVLVLLFISAISSSQEKKTLAEKLGYKATDKLLIINVDDAGNLHSTNLAVFQGMEKGIVTTSTVMVPCSWFYEVALYQKIHPEADFGVHLTHREPLLGPYRYGPVAGRNEVPGLYNPEGFFWTTPAQFLAHSNPQEAEIEGRAQIKKALAAGMDISHLDSHTGILSASKEYFEVYVKLAREFDLPVRFAGGIPENRQSNEQNESGNVLKLLDNNGIFHTDYIISPAGSAKETARESWKRLLLALKPGVTEAFCHACVSTDESQAALRDAKNVPLQSRVEDFNAVANDPEIRKILEDQGIIRIKWKVIRDLQRKSRNDDKQGK
ncbi:MAG: polysaccharide deacetylase family protein [Bacteroidia bacterium]|nr:polysaccharide deacetylase family protein [Bacteroidia bacterium]